MFATIIDRKFGMHDGVPSLEKMQEVVGGYIETALRCPSPTRKNISVDAYVNEEGLMIGLPIDHVRMTDRSYLAGNIIITGADERTGDTVAVTKEEINALLKHIGILPITLMADGDVVVSV